MEEYIFLFVLGIIWSVFASVQDLKTREVSNWLNFSLIGFAFAYRAFYSVFNSDWSFFVYGLIGFCVFFALAHAFYYGRVFAGGDAKLLMGFGVLLPYSNFIEFIYTGIAFVLVLFTMGSIWSLIYSVFIVRKNWLKFKKEFKRRFFAAWVLVVILLVLIFAMFFVFDLVYWSVFSLCFIGILFLYFYVKALDKCMIIEKDARELQEGDWLEKDIRVGQRVIKKSVHGLSLEEIRLLKKAGKKVLIKDGVPFTIAFLLALIVIWYLFLAFGGFAALDFFGLIEGFGF